MKLRFEVDQAESFRRGVDCPKSIVSVEVDPAQLDRETRELVASRLEGIDVMKLTRDTRPTGKILHQGDPMRERAEMASTDEIVKARCRLKAMLPTLEALIESVRFNDLELALQVGEMRYLEARYREAFEHGHTAYTQLVKYSGDPNQRKVRVLVEGREFMECLCKLKDADDSAWKGPAEEVLKVAFRSFKEVLDQLPQTPHIADMCAKELRRKAANFSTGTT